MGRAVRIPCFLTDHLDMFGEAVVLALDTVAGGMAPRPTAIKHCVIDCWAYCGSILTPDCDSLPGAFRYSLVCWSRQSLPSWSCCGGGRYGPPLNLPAASWQTSGTLLPSSLGGSSTSLFPSATRALARVGSTGVGVKVGGEQTKTATVVTSEGAGSCTSVARGGLWGGWGTRCWLRALQGSTPIAH